MIALFNLGSLNMPLSLSTGPVRDTWNERDSIYIHVTLGLMPEDVLSTSEQTCMCIHVTFEELVL